MTWLAGALVALTLCAPSPVEPTDDAPAAPPVRFELRLDPSLQLQPPVVYPVVVPDHTRELRRQLAKDILRVQFAMSDDSDLQAFEVTGYVFLGLGGMLGVPAIIMGLILPDFQTLGPGAIGSSSMAMLIIGGAVAGAGSVKARGLLEARGVAPHSTNLDTWGWFMFGGGMVTGVAQLGLAFSDELPYAATFMELLSLAAFGAGIVMHGIDTDRSRQRLRRHAIEVLDDPEPEFAPVAAATRDGAFLGLAGSF